jgi:OOP family OmpA-OmpF porin
MMRKTWLLLVALALAAGCASEPPKPEAPKPAPAPAPAPVPRAEAPKPPPKPVAEKVTFSTDVLFDFNRADIKPDGQKKLDELQGRMKGVSVEVVIAIGHADRLGSDTYNQKLSVRRADAAGLPRVQGHREPYTEGKAEQPVSGDKCKGRRRSQNEALDACSPIAECSRSARARRRRSSETPLCGVLFQNAAMLNADPAELEKSRPAASRWWDPRANSGHCTRSTRYGSAGPRASVARRQDVLDVGCGGATSPSMARSGARHRHDPSESAAVAELHLLEQARYSLRKILC